MTNHMGTIRKAIQALVCIASAIGAQAGPPTGGAPRTAATAAAQAGGRMTGLVVNARSAEPVTGAAVTIRNAADSALVGGGFTKADGSFHIEGLRPGLYTVRVRVIGYAPVVKTGVRVTPAAPSADVGRFVLTPVAAELSTVTVTEERSDVALAPDRNS